MFDTCGDILTIAEVAELLQIGRGKVYELLQSGELKGWHPGCSGGEARGLAWRIPKDALNEYVKEQISRKK